MNINNLYSRKKQIGAAAIVVQRKKKASRESFESNNLNANKPTSSQPKLEEFMSMSQGPHVVLQQKLKSACREPKSPKSQRFGSKPRSEVNDSKKKVESKLAP